MSVLPVIFNNKFLKAVFGTINKYRMLAPYDSVLAGVSGGPDSIVLVNVLRHFCSKFSLNLGIAHLNHCLRGENSDNDACFVAELSRRLELPCFIERKDVKLFQKQNKLSLEEAGRRVRYDFFEQTAKKNGYNKIALGHHADDNAELVLMYMIRGSGPRGLSGISPVRSQRYIRPLIHNTRHEIMEFIQTNDLAYVIDMSNQDTRYLRNRIRHQLIPDLKALYNPEISCSLNRLSSIIRDEEQWIEEITAPVFKSCVIWEKKGQINLCISELNKLHDSAKRRVIRKTIEQVKGSLRRISFSHIEDILTLAKTNKGPGALDLPDQVRVKKNHKSILIVKEKSDLRSVHFNSCLDIIPYKYTIQKPGSLNINETGMCLNFSVLETGFEDLDFRENNQAFFDMDMVKFPLIVRTFIPGDRFTPQGMTGTQKVKKFFINNKISAKDRARCPILVCQNKIIWLAGFRIDESVKVTQSTRKVLKAELLLA
ncbi:tRNA(Ile)-lysidine synthase [Desulfonema limicola]|uniref:tRNA(Ile)-lysidine synthase n=1 Tax=Desulfonema limicola TaxID=45656 RepID=A0A975BES1_9BACT|nr:tRNA lysidine(34) synthetase TilS [Desulfonema limicola]QTA83770.1 tRNA(Ile)-lysidine synthase [Desulfonema limicola]